MVDVSRIRDQLLPDPTAGPLGSGIVTAVSKASAPWLVTVRLADGTTQTMLAAGWYNPVVNDVVLVYRQAGAYVCLGSFAGVANVVATTATLTTIGAPATPPAPPTLPTTVRTAFVSADSSKTWAAGAWRTDNDQLYQTGDTAQRAFWFYGTKIATAKGAGTIISATIWIPRQASAHGADRANVRLGTHGFATLPGSGASALGNVQSYAAAVPRGGDVAIALTAGQLAALNGGAAGVGLEPGTVGGTNADYLIAVGKTTQPATGQLALTISG
jgi:hypothetical protein